MLTLSRIRFGFDWSPGFAGVLFLLFEGDLRGRLGPCLSFPSSVPLCFHFDFLAFNLSHQVDFQSPSVVRSCGECVGYLCAFGVGEEYEQGRNPDSIVSRVKYEA